MKGWESDFTPVSVPSKSPTALSQCSKSNNDAGSEVKERKP